MTLAVLFHLFSTFSDYALQHPTKDVLTIVALCPADQATFVGIAEEAFAQFQASDDEVQLRRFETIYRLMLFIDGRTFLGCLRFATLASAMPSCGDWGVNSLAALVNYLRSGRSVLPLSAAELFPFFESLQSNEDLAHNASECVRFLQNRE